MFAGSSRNVRPIVAFARYLWGMLAPARILAVEDEPDLIELIKYHLLRAGHLVATAGTGWDALEQIRANGPI